MADKYYINDAITKPAIHHESFKALWETKWRKPVGPPGAPTLRRSTQTDKRVV